tara:strand:- start:630 stop:3377 length:2748 start_codon:yes stop_codon:yes gene_type:complete
MNFLKLIAYPGFALIISACSESDSSQTYINKAQILMDEKQNSAAIILLKNALQLDAGNALARYLLGQLYLTEGDAIKAIKELERAHKLKFNVDKVIPLLARAYMLEEYDEDIILLASQEKLLSTSITQYLAYKTIALLRTENSSLAAETVEKALVLSQTDSYSMLASAYLEFSQRNLSHANTLVERILMAAPSNLDALMLQGQIAIANKNYPLAVESFKHYFKLQPNMSKVKLFIADALVKNGQFDEAEEIADSILQQVPTQPFLQYIKALARFENKDYEAVSRYANQSLSSGFNSFSLKLVAGASAFYLQNYEQSHYYLQDLMPYISADHPARRMLAISQLQLGLIDDISETLTGYDATTKENALFLSSLSYELLEVGAFEKAQEVAKYAANPDEVNAEQTARTGLLKLMMNDPSGIESLELALQQNPELISAELALAFASIKSGDLSRASNIADKWLKEYPNKAGGYNLQATILLKEKKFDEGKKALEQSLKVEPNNVYALTQLVKLAHYQKETKQAISLTEQALKIHPDNIDILRQYFEYHKDLSGLEVVSKAQDANVDNVQYGILLAEALMQLDEFKQASSVLSSYQQSVKTPKRYWQLLLAASAKQTEDKDIFSILDKWHKTNAYHIEPVLLLANYWSRKKLPDRAISVLNDALKKHPNSVMLHLVKMQALLDNNRTMEAKAVFKTLENFNVNKSLLVGIEGRILLLEKDYAKAVLKLEQFYKAKPDSTSATYLAFALEGNNQKSAAIKLLEQHSSSHDIDKEVNPRVNFILANMYLAEHKDKAVVEYERLIKAVPNNIVALNNLSWLYMDQGRYKQALEYSIKAYSLSSNIPNVVDTYAQVLLKLDKKVEALSKAEEAYELSKGKDTDIALNFAEILLANNKAKEAKSILANINTTTLKQQEKKQALLK